ncbi:DUF559 domain-containing protein [Aminobacter sp. AP02]|uniref:endonuclease domain-containing protein n=1 Tax=Aminobacter sp. AP02 TaxID=2135737 RepID=UPI000D6C4BF2|nr:DUF559 domain-containing protein [Aminobacter sp. AP02]PWK63838.1 very-short-patch-repair endonuclease [Aminobacter sp. AP02]
MRGPQLAKTNRARSLRKADNDAEQALWTELRDRRLNGYKFNRQLPIGPYYADFACREAKLVVELDGSHHAGSEHDPFRDQYMLAEDWSILRLWNVDALKERESVMDTILAALEGRLEKQVDAVDLRFLAAAGYGEQRH